MAKRATQARYSAQRGVGQWCVFDNVTRKRVSSWMPMLDAALEASKRNDVQEGRQTS